MRRFRDTRETMPPHCPVLSFLLLASSLTYQWTGFAYADSIGALGIMWFAYQEGQEAFALAANKQNVCCSKSCH